MDSLHTYEPTCKDDLGAFETEREEAHRQLMREELKEEIYHRDNLLYTNTSRICPICGGKLYAHGRTNVRSYISVCGEVKVRLRRLYCNSCGHLVVPGYALIPKGNISAHLSEKMCDLAAKMSYDKASESLYIHHGIKVSPKRFWTSIQTEASLVGDVLAGEAETLYREAVMPQEIDLKGEKPLIIGLDGGWVRGWQSCSDFEVKCATIATGSFQGRGKRRYLKDRVGYAAQCSIDEFRQRISVLAIKSGYLTASSCIFVSDGASWIAKMIADYFPGSIHVLDLFHLKRKVELLFGIKAEGAVADIRDAALGACDAFEPEDISAIIKSWVTTEVSKIEQKADLLSYIKNNAEAIKNHQVVDIHGSGWIEKGVDLMVSRRMKNRGMSWTERGSSNIIPFSVLRYNKQWDVYWGKRRGLSDLVAN